MGSFQSVQIPTVLVVEDETVPRILTAMAFEDAGYAVAEAQNAAGAISILGDQYIDFLFTDIDMPGGMNGVALAAYAREHWPFVEIAVTSGKAIPTHAALPERTRFFLKPYNTRLVIDHVRATIRAAV
jgi:two-component system, response regulator PdtaR